MKAFYITAPGKTEFREVDRPAPAGEEVLLRVRRVGYCGSDLNTFRGRNPMVSFPRVPGHEIAATIEQAGPDVPGELRPGLNVTLSPYTSCGRCRSCRNARPNACEHNQTMGVQRDGAMTAYVVAPWRKLYPSAKLTLEELAVVEPLTVGFHAADRGRVQAGETAGVFGCGAIGLGAVAGAACRGAEVVAIDVDDAKLAVARKAGARHTVNSAAEDLHERLAAIIPGGPDVMIEAVGLPETFRAAVAEVCFTGRVVYIGYAKEPVCYETKLFVQKELDILGSRNALGDFAGVIEMLESGRLSAADLITEVVPFEAAGEVLRRWDANPGAFTRILVDLDR